MSALSSTYYEKLIGHASASFVNLIQTEKSAYGFKIGKIKGYQIFFEQSPSGTDGSRKKNFQVEGMTRMRRKSHNLCPNFSILATVCFTNTHLIGDSTTPTIYPPLSVYHPR